jgi:hypothetical protein
VTRPALRANVSPESSPISLNPAHLRRLRAAWLFDRQENESEIEMRKILLLVMVLYSAAAIAQSNPPASPPTVGDKPLVQVKPKGTAAAAKSKAAPEKPKSMAAKLQACLEIDDATKERLNCYDAVIPPKPKAKGNPKADAKAAPPKAVTECSAIKEEDERLTCFNGFVEKLPKLPS